MCDGAWFDEAFTETANRIGTAVPKTLLPYGYRHLAQISSMKKWSNNPATQPANGATAPMCVSL
jgi:hypothetical protein